MAHRMLKNAGIAPPWIESDKEARRLLAALAAMLERAPRASRLARDRLRRDYLATVQAANRAIERVNAEAPTDRQHRRPLDTTAEVELSSAPSTAEGGRRASAVRPRRAPRPRR